MRAREGEAKRWAKFSEHIEEGYGISTARHGDQDGLAAVEQLVAANGFEDARREARRRGQRRPTSRERGMSRRVG